MSTRSILISYAGYPFTPSSLMPDNGLANLAGALLEAGHETFILDYGTTDTMSRLYPRWISCKTRPIYQRLLDGNVKVPRASFKEALSLKYLNYKLEKNQRKVVSEIADEIVEKTREVRPDFVGFKLWNGDGFTGSISIAERVRREFPSLKIFAGGPHVDIFKKHIYSVTDVFDALVYAEGEEVILLLCEHSSGKVPLSEIPNIVYKHNGTITINSTKWIDDLDRLPFPVYDENIYPSLAGDRKIKIIVIDESRGCPHRCAFCIQPIKSGSKLRLKSPRRVVDDIKKIMNSLGVTCFRYAGSTTPLKHAVDIADKILGENLTITYSSFGHIQKGDISDFEILKKSGCHSIFFGIESGSREILHRGFSKRIEPELIHRTLMACRDAGIFTVGSMIFPGPFETSATEAESIALLTEAAPDSVPIQFPGIYPETDWRRAPGKYNFQIKSRNYERQMMNYKIKLLYPPTYWAPLPYRLNNMSYKQFARKTDEFAQKLESSGILTHLSDDQALMALHAGYRGREREFRDNLRFAFIAGDLNYTRELVHKINSEVGRASHT